MSDELFLSKQIASLRRKYAALLLAARQTIAMTYITKSLSDAVYELRKEK